MSRLLVFSAALALLAPSARAFDSSGGARTADLLSRIEFQEPIYPDLDAPVHPWDDAHKAAAVAWVKRVIETMPINAAELPFIKRIILSNSENVCDERDMAKLRSIADSHANDPEPPLAPLSAKAVLWEDCVDGGFRSPLTAEIGVAGAYRVKLAGQRLEGGFTDLASGVLFHEFFHAWQSSHELELKSFYKLRWKRIGRIWSRSRDAHENYRIGKAGSPDFDAAGEEIERIEEALYAAWKLPSRRLKNGKPERYPMKDEDEYSASLAQVMWIEPSKAEQWTVEERDWMERRAFRGRRGVGHGRLTASGPSPAALARASAALQSAAALRLP